MTIQVLEIPPRRAIAIDGTGKQGGEEFEAAIGALYAVAYPLRFALKARGVDHKVAHLEALWDLDWRWKLFLPLPEEATDAEIVTEMDEFAADLGYALSGPHHEIYLSDPTRTKPEKLRTILRHPVTAAGI